MSQSLIYPGTSVAGELNLSHYVAFGFLLSARINLIHWFLEISFCPLIQCRLIWFQFVPVGNKIHNQCSGRSIVNSLRSDLVFSLQNNLAVTPFKQGHFFYKFHIWKTKCSKKSSVLSKKAMILYLLTSTIIFQNQALKCTNGCEKILLVIVNQKLSIKVLPFAQPMHM